MEKKNLNNFVILSLVRFLSEYRFLCKWWFYLLIKVDSDITGYEDLEITSKHIFKNELRRFGIDVKTLEDFLPEELKAKSVQGDFARYIGAKDIECPVGVIWTPSPFNGAEISLFESLKNEHYKGLLIVRYTDKPSINPYIKKACEHADASFGILDLMGLSSFLQKRFQ